MKLDILYQIVGKTRTGKLIVCALKFENIDFVAKYFARFNFSNDDLLDAYALFEYLSIREKRKNDSLMRFYSEHSSEIHKIFSPEEYAEAKLKAGIVTAFDLRRLGETLANIEFKDL